MDRAWAEGLVKVLALSRSARCAEKGCTRERGPGKVFVFEGPSFDGRIRCEAHAEAEAARFNATAQPLWKHSFTPSGQRLLRHLARVRETELDPLKEALNAEERERWTRPSVVDALQRFMAWGLVADGYGKVGASREAKLGTQKVYGLTARGRVLVELLGDTYGKSELQC